MRSGADQIMWDRLFRLSSDSGISLQRQIRKMLVTAVLDGLVPTEAPLPSCRELARQLNVARNTVVLAYQHLVEEGYLVSRERSGYYVNVDILDGRVRSQATPEPAQIAREPEWRARFRAAPSHLRNIEKPLDWQRYEFPFIYGQVDPTLFPIHDWRECCRQTLSVRTIRTLTHDRIDADDPLLVEQLQTRVLPRRGVWASTDEILLTLGAQNALYLLASLLITEDSVVGIENPGYPDARNIFSLKTPLLRPLTVDDAGLAIDQRLGDCDYLYVTPSHQSPTTVTLPLERRRALLKLAGDRDLVIFEDDYESEINYLDSPTPALKSLDHCGRVLYVGSLSKTLDPGLRIGYLVGPAELIREARALRRLMLRHPPTNNQRTVALFLSLGHYDALLKRLAEAYQVRWQAMGDALQRYLPESTRPPTFGGTSYWVQGPTGLDARELKRKAARQGILVEAGDVYFLDEKRPMNYFRLGFSSIPVERIEAGVQALSRLIGTMTG